MIADVRLLTVKDYHDMIKAGIIAPDERVELIAGQIIKMAAKGTAHAATVTRTERVLRNGLGDRALLRLQDPIQLDDYSEPEPDIAVVYLDPLDYGNHHPNPDEIFLIIEVTDTTFPKDYAIKAPMYARSRILDYWLLDVNHRRLFVFRLPSQNVYQNEQVLTEDEFVSPLAFPDLVISVRDMLNLIN